MKPDRGLFFWCFLLVLFGVLGPSSHASEEIDCNEIFQNFFRIRNINSSDLTGLIPKAGDKDFKISLEKAIDTRFYDPLLMITDMMAIQLAHHYRITFTYNDALKESYLIIAATSQGHQNLDELKTMESVLKKLPSVILQKVDRIKVYSPSFDWPVWVMAGASPSRGGGYIFIPPPKILKRQNSLLLQTFQHEFGHIMAFTHYGSIDGIPDQHWLKAIEADGNDISPQGREDLGEDFAEAMRVYLATEGGLQDPYQRQIFHHRFKILDQILKVDTRQLDKLVLEQNTGGML